MSRLICLVIVMGCALMSSAVANFQPPKTVTPPAPPTPPVKTAPATKAAEPAKGATPAKAADVPDAKELALLREKKSYAYGLDIARAIVADEMDFDLQSLVKGLSDGIKKQKPTLTDKEYNELMAMIVTEVRTKADERFRKVKAENQRASDKFMAENGKKEGIVTMPNGLQYRVIKQGEGKTSPTATSSVKVHVKATMIDGTEFYSTYTENKPTTFRVTRVIRGFREALLQMKQGDRWIVYIPPDLAFAEEGNPPTAVGLPPVGPNQAVIYEIDLLEISEMVDE
jgi:FKBP-type peptidyl-prolyl cis-trans isomerase